MNRTKRDIRNNKAGFRIENNILIGDELEYPEAHQNAGDIILEIFQKKPDQMGQIDSITGKKDTYKEMREKTVKCAIWLRQQGIKPGDVVAICSSTHFNNYVPLLATTYIGAVSAVEHHKLPTRTFRDFLNKVTPKMIFLHESTLENFKVVQNELNMKIQRVLFEDRVPNEVSLDDILSRVPVSEVDKFRCAQIDDPNQTVLYLSTSGSTGMPKIAELTHLSFKTILHPEYVTLIKGRICMCTTGIRWLYFIVFLLIAIRGNSTRIIVEETETDKHYGEVIKKYKVEFYGAETNQLKKIYKLGLTDLYRSTDLKIIIFGGSPFSSNIHKTLRQLMPRINLMQVYGSTDIGNYISEQNGKNCKPGSCGYVRAGVKIKIVDVETGEILGPNKQGEICVMTATQMKGYLNNPEATNKAIDPEGWIHPGDLGYYDDDGELYITGRTSEFIKYQDSCLSAVAMEKVLEEHPSVYRAAVVGAPDEIETEIPFAFVTKLPNKEVTESELIRHFKDNLPSFYFLKGIKFVDVLPITQTGKIAKMELKKQIHNDGTL